MESRHHQSGQHRLAKLDNGNSVRFLEIGAKLRQPDGTLSRDIYSDGTHLLPAGYTIWADAIQPTLQALLGNNWQPVRTLPQPPTPSNLPGSAAPGVAPLHFVAGAMKNLNQVPSWGNAKVELVPDAERGKILRVQFGHINKADWYGGFGLALQAPTAGEASDVVGFGFPVKGDGSYPNSTYVTLTTDKGVGYISGNISAIYEDEAWHDFVLNASDFKLDPEWIKKNAEAAKAQSPTLDFREVRRLSYTVVAPLMSQKTIALFGDPFFELKTPN